MSIQGTIVAVTTLVVVAFLIGFGGWLLYDSHQKAADRKLLETMAVSEIHQNVDAYIAANK